MKKSSTLDNGFFVVGNVGNGLPIEDDLVSSYKKLTLSGSDEARNFMGDFNLAPFAVGLLYENPSSSPIKLTRDRTYINMTQNAEMISYLKKTLVDLLVYSHDGQTVR